MKKLIIPILLTLLLAAFLTPSCTPCTPGGQPETNKFEKTITTDTMAIRKYHVSEFSYGGRRYLLMEAPGHANFEIVPIF